MRRTTRAAAVTLAAALALTACGGDEGTSAAGGDGETAYPEEGETLEWTIAFGPGGGNDIMSRQIIEILQQEELWPGDINPQNREGGSGATGWGYLLNQAGDPYAISTTSGSFITTPLQADTGWTYEDFTPVGYFATDDAYFVVPSGTGIESWEQWVEFAQSEGTVQVGGIGTVNVDFILHSLLAEQAGYEIDYVPFNEEGQLQTALLSGALDAIVSNTGSILGQIQAEEVTPLLFTGPERLEVLPDVPAAEELGITDLVTQPRGLILPPDVDPAVQDWWIETMQQVVETPAWQEYIESEYLTPQEAWGEDFTAVLDDTSTRFETILQEQGAL